MNTNSYNLIELLDQLSEVIAVKVSDKINISPVSVQNTDKDEEYLDTQETLKYINIKTRVTLDKYVVEGRIEKPIQRGGRKLYYRKSSLIKFLQNG